MNKNKLPKDWKIVNLKNITDSIQYGYTESSSTVEIGPKFLRITDIQENKVNWEAVPYCKIDEVIKSKYLLKDGDLVFARTGATVGKSFLIKGKIPEAVFASYLIRVRVNLEINEKYLSYFFQSPEYWKQITNDQVGTGQPNVNGTKLGLLKIVIAPLETQTLIVYKIEELFSELDKGIEDLKTAQQQLKTYRQSVLKWAFEGKLTNKKVKDGELPKGWFWTKFGDVVNNFDGKRRPLSRNVRATRKGEFRYYGATEIVDYIDDFIFDGKYLLIGEDGANLVSKSRALAFMVEGKFWVNNHAHIVQTKDILNIDYLSYYFNSLNLAEYVTGTAQPKLNQANMNKIPIPISNIDEQGKIVEELENRLSVADKMEESIAQSLQHAEALRQSILKKAFSGELV